MKRVLVRSFGLSPAQPAVPTQYLQSKQRWLCEIIVENDKNIVQEYEIKHDGRLYLDDFLGIIKNELEHLGEESSSSWQVHVYRISNSV